MQGGEKVYREQTWLCDKTQLLEMISKRKEEYPDLPVINATNIGYYVFPQEWRINRHRLSDPVEIPGSEPYTIKEGV